MQTPLRGVNFGGWLVLERWMTPQLFKGSDARDEYEFMQTPGAKQKLQKHHKMFITEEDFSWLAAHGYNAVRIPIGYWILDGDTPYLSCIERLDWALQMADKYHIHILISLHGAPGSQNGQDHSGKAGKMDWHRHRSYQQQTTSIITRLAKRYYHQKSLWGIELLNEPTYWRYPLVLRRFYKETYTSIQAVARPGLVTVFSDGFMPRALSGALSAHPNYPIAMDTHWYHFFTPRLLQRFLPLSVYQWRLRRRQALLIRLSKKQPIIMGEWSGVIGGEALHRYPKKQHEDITRAHLREQQTLLANLAGWFYWSYKTEDRGIFHFRSMVEDGHTDKPF